MNVVRFMVLVILVIAGYGLYDPVFGSKGIVTGLLDKSSDNEQVVEDSTDGDTSQDTIGKKPVVKVKENKPVEFSLALVKRSDFPSECEITKDSAKAVLLEGGELNLEQGSVLIPLALSDEVITVRIEDLGVRAKVAVSSTDFEALVRPVTLARLNSPEDSTKPEPTVVDSGVKPDQTPAVTPKVEPQPRVEPKVEPQPKVEPKRLARLNRSQILQLLKQEYVKKASLKQQKILSAELAPDERIDEVDYQVGMITFEKDSLFGIRKFQVKALIHDGKFKKWVWHPSNMELK